MPYRFTEDEIREYWSYCGEVESLDAMTFPDTGRFRGIAFVTFKTEEAYQAALACDGEDCEGRRLAVRPCKGKGDGARGGAGVGSANAKPRLENFGAKTKGYLALYVGNLPFDVDADTVQSLFAPHNATHVTLHTDKATGRGRGFAHVYFASEDDLDKAVQLDRTDFLGRELRVSYARPKE